jgi:DNA-binding CsgD family transcriptional regulator
MDLDRVHRSRIREIEASLRTFDGGLPVLRRVVDGLTPLLDAEHGLAYGFEPAEDRLRVAFLHGTSTYPWSGYRADLDALVRRTPVGWANYNPIRPERGQQNRLTASPIYDPRRQGAYGEMVRRHEFAASGHQLRVLVCEDGALDAWVGVVRTDPFTDRERRVFGRVLPALRTRLSLERKLETSAITTAALGAVLEQLGAAAFVVRDPCAVVHANSVGRALLDRSRAETLEALRASRLGVGDRYDVSRIDAPGIPGYWLAIARPTDATETRVDAAAGRWGLTRRQREVLLQIARGESNKSIAARLGCTEGTIEFHVTALLQKAGADGRSRLIAQLLSST